MHREGCSHPRISPQICRTAVVADGYAQGMEGREGETARTWKSREASRLSLFGLYSERRECHCPGG